MQTDFPNRNHQDEQSSEGVGSGGPFQLSTRRQGTHWERNSESIENTRSKTYQVRSRTQQRISNDSTSTNEAPTTKRRTKGANNPVLSSTIQGTTYTNGDPVTKIKESKKINSECAPEEIK